MSGPVAWWERRWVGDGALEDTVTQMTELEWLASRCSACCRTNAPAGAWWHKMHVSSAFVLWGEGKVWSIQECQLTAELRACASRPLCCPRTWVREGTFKVHITTCIYFTDKKNECSSVEMQKIWNVSVRVLLFCYIKQSLLNATRCIQCPSLSQAPRDRVADGLSDG